MLTSSPLPAEQEDFSLVLGGPLYQLWRRLHAAGPALDLLVRRMIGIPLVAWLPLLIMTVYEGVAIGHAVPVPFLYDFEAHVRFLVAIPLFLLAEVVVHQRIRPVVRSFVDAGIVTPEVLPGFQAAIARALRLRNSLGVELTLVVLVFGLGWMLGKEALSLGTPTWYAVSDGAGQHLTAAGQWYIHVSIPIFQFLLLRWYFRLFVWFLFLWRVSRLDLRLTPSHPDRAGGLGFLSAGPIAFAPVILAQSAVLSGLIGASILFQGATLASFRYEIAAFVILELAMVLGPLCVFAPRLLALKRQGRREYGALAGPVHARVPREMDPRRRAGRRAPRGERGHPVAGGPGQQLRGGPGHAGGALRSGHHHPTGRARLGAAPSAGAYRAAGRGDSQAAGGDAAVAIAAPASRQPRVATPGWHKQHRVVRRRTNGRASRLSVNP